MLKLKLKVPLMSDHHLEFAYESQADVMEAVAESAGYYPKGRSGLGPI